MDSMPTGYIPGPLCFLKFLLACRNRAFLIVSDNEAKPFLRTMGYDNETLDDAAEKGLRRFKGGA